MGRFTDWVLSHRRWVALAWVAVAVAGGALAPTTVDRLSYEFALPGQPAYETNTEIVETFGGGGSTDPRALGVAVGLTAATRLPRQGDSRVERRRWVKLQSPGAAFSSGAASSSRTSRGSWRRASRRWRGRGWPRPA